jgi:hypothetical protein
MARPIEKKDYQDSDERVATFRISHGKLTAFQDVCAAKGTSVSQALIGFIDTAINGGDIPEKESRVSLPKNLATQDDVSQAIAQVQSKFQTELGQVKLWFHDTAPTFEAIEELKTELETKFQNELGEFKSFVADTAPTLDGMNGAIAPLKEELNRLKAMRSEFQELKMKIEDLKIVLDPDGDGRFFALLEEFKDQFLPCQEMLEQVSISEDDAAPIDYFPEADAKSTGEMVIAVDDGQNESQVAGKEAESKINAIQGNLLDVTETGDLKVSDDKDEKGCFSCYTDLESLTTRELRPMARQARIQGSRTMSKPQLIEALQAKAEKTKLSAQ